MELILPDSELVPPPVRSILEGLERDGHEAVLVGGCVRDLLLGCAVTDFDITTSAAPEVVLERFERAIPTGLRHGTVTIPTAAGPVDVTTFRAGPCCREDLAHRDFTVNAIAWSPTRGELIDPFEGLADLHAGRLRTVGPPGERFAEDALRAVRAARFVATLELEPDPELEPAMRAARDALRRVARERIRRELEALLGAPHPGRGVALLRRTGIEADLLPGAPEDAALVVEALPADLELRLAAWLRGTDAEALLGRLRFPLQVTRAVGRLVRLHPIERWADPAQLADVRRLIRRAGERGVDALFALREAELEADAPDPAARAETRQRLAGLREAVTRVKRMGRLALRRSDLAVDGAEVMRTLALQPGPAVGEALRYLTERVIEDPACNDEETLRELLRQWHRETRGRPAANGARSGSR